VFDIIGYFLVDNATLQKIIPQVLGGGILLFILVLFLRLKIPKRKKRKKEKKKE